MFDLSIVESKYTLSRAHDAENGTAPASIMARCKIGTLIIACVISMGAKPACAGIFDLALHMTVNSTVDAVDASPGNGVCATVSGKCTLRAAIQEANAWPGKDQIKLPAGTYRLTLLGKGEFVSAAGDLNITQSVTIQGAGVGKTYIDGGVCANVDDPDCTSADVGSQTDRVLSILNKGANPTVELSGLTIQNGGGIDVWSGGIYVENGGTLYLFRCRVRENKARMFGGGIGNSGKLHVMQSTIIRNTLPIDALGGQTASGGGIMNFASGTVEIDRSLIAENEAARGGGIRNAGGMVRILNSTISGNKATASGGGINNAGTTQIAFSTIAFNEANRNVASSGSEPKLGGGIYNTDQLSLDGKTSTVSIGNSIVAKNTDNHFFGNEYGPDCFAQSPGKVASFRGNVIGIRTGTCNLQDGLWGGVLFDQSGSQYVPLDPHLAPLAANGGPTRTHALLTGSPAIDKAIGLLGGTIYDCAESDQRLFVRPRDGDSNGSKQCDVGAFEAKSVAAGK